MIIQLIGKKGSGSVLIEKTATTNDIYRASDFNADGFDVFTVAVPNGTETKTITSNGTYTPTAPNIGFSSVSVDVPEPSGTISITTNGLKDVKNYEYADINVSASSPVINPLTVTPSTSSQSIVAPSGIDGFSPVTVSAVDSTIDQNIVAGNIKSGVSILGVEGNVVELQGEARFADITSPNATTITPSTGKNGITSITVTPRTTIVSVRAMTTAYTVPLMAGYCGYREITVQAVDANIDSNIQPENIKDGVTILGVTGNYGGGTPVNSIQFVNNNGMLQAPVTMIDLTGITNIGDYVLRGAYSYSVISGSIDMSNIQQMDGAYACREMFAFCYHITSIDLSSLTTIDGYYACQSMFSSCSALVSADLGSLTGIIGNGGCNNMFAGCSSLTSVDLSSLETVTAGNACASMFYGCTSLTTLSFPSLKSTAFGSYTNQFRDMLSGVTGCTVHFPSNLQSVIGSWPDVTNGFGGTNTTVLFDLPATE